MKVLIVGGENSLENRMAAALRREGHSAFLFEDASYSGKNRERSLLQVFEDRGIEAVIHLDSDHSEKHFQDLTILMEAMKKAGVRRLIYQSVSSVFGDRRPSHPETRSRMMAEMLIEDVVQTGDLGAVILRSLDTMTSRTETRILPRILRASLGPSYEISLGGEGYGTADGFLQRDLLHEEDFIEAYVLALASVKIGKLADYELGSGREHSMNEILKACERVTGQSVPVSAEGAHFELPSVLRADLLTLQECLGWSPRHESLDEIVAHAWEQCRAEEKQGRRPLSMDRRKLLRFFESQNPATFASLSSSVSL